MPSPDHISFSERCRYLEAIREIPAHGVAEGLTFAEAYLLLRLIDRSPHNVRVPDLMKGAAPGHGLATVEKTKEVLSSLMKKRAGVRRTHTGKAYRYIGEDHGPDTRERD